VDGLSEIAKPQNPAESGIFREIRPICTIRVKKRRNWDCSINLEKYKMSRYGLYTTQRLRPPCFA
jgi:hypothetical protein